jgi:hypothetical protein
MKSLRKKLATVLRQTITTPACNSTPRLNQLPVHRMLMPCRVAVLQDRLTRKLHRLVDWRLQLLWPQAAPDSTLWDIIQVTPSRQRMVRWGNKITAIFSRKTWSTRWDIRPITLRVFHRLAHQQALRSRRSTCRIFLTFLTSTSDSARRERQRQLQQVLMRFTNTMFTSSSTRRLNNTGRPALGRMRRKADRRARTLDQDLRQWRCSSMSTAVR